MALHIAEVSTFFDPPLCANNCQKGDQGTPKVCLEKAKHACGSCRLVQYCSKECQTSDWKHHKATCRSALMKDSWVPQWWLEGRKPAFVTKEHKTFFGTDKFLWGHMPAIDVLKINDNEGETDTTSRDFSLLFAASGDLRNVIKSVAGLAEAHSGACHAVINDKDIIIVARNIIMLMAALVFDAQTATPMIIHLWYSATLPRAMIDALQAHVLPMIREVCDKIKKRSATSIYAHTFNINGRSLYIIISKGEWFTLKRFFTVPDQVTLDKAQRIRHGITLAPELVDYREKRYLNWPPAQRVVDMHFRETGVLLPLGCSISAFDTPNPTLFQDKYWPTDDTVAPTRGWDYHEYLKHAPNDKLEADENGALFFYLRDLLVKFCARLRSVDINFEMLCIDARDLEEYVGNQKFDRIEISCLCDRSHLGPKTSIEIFVPLLKPKTENPKATLLMLFLNAARETERGARGTAKASGDVDRALIELSNYLPLHMHPQEFMAIVHSPDRDSHPDPLRRGICHPIFKHWNHWFNVFLKDTNLVAVMRWKGVRIKSKHTLVHQWPRKVGKDASQEEFEAMCKSGTVGCERYVEVEQI